MSLPSATLSHQARLSTNIGAACVGLRRIGGDPLPGFIGEDPQHVGACQAGSVRGPINGSDNGQAIIAGGALDTAMGIWYDTP